jgi:hypothetical protein
LATKGVFTCVVVLIFLPDNTLLLAHVDSTIFDANTDEPLVEIQNIIEHVILMLDVNYKDIMIETVFVIGGVQNDEYEKLNDFLSLLRRTPSIIILGICHVLPILGTLNSVLSLKNNIFVK